LDFITRRSWVRLPSYAITFKSHPKNIRVAFV